VGFRRVYPKKKNKVEDAAGHDIEKASRISIDSCLQPTDPCREASGDMLEFTRQRIRFTTIRPMGGPSRRQTNGQDENHGEVNPWRETERESKQDRDSRSRINRPRATPDRGLSPLPTRWRQTPVETLSPAPLHYGTRAGVRQATSLRRFASLWASARNTLRAEKMGRGKSASTNWR